MIHLPKGILEHELIELFDLQDAQRATENKQQVKQLTKKQIKQQHFETASENERQKMIQLFKQFGVQHFEFTSVKGHDRVDGYYTASTGTEYFFEVKTRSNDASGYTYSTVIEKSKLNYILEQSKNMKHKPLVFFFFASGDCHIEQLNRETYYTGFSAYGNQTTADGNTTKVLKDYIPFKINPNKLIRLK